MVRWCGCCELVVVGGLRVGVVGGASVHPSGQCDERRPAGRTMPHSAVPIAEAAAGHATALLGVVTHAANNFKAVVVSEDGTSTTRVLRDSTDKPKAKRVLATPPAPPPATTLTAPAKTEVTVAPWRPPAPAALAKRRRAETDAEALAASVERIGSSMSSRSHALTGKQRLAALASRVASNSQQ